MVERPARITRTRSGGAVYASICLLTSRQGQHANASIWIVHRLNTFRMQILFILGAKTDMLLTPFTDEIIKVQVIRKFVLGYLSLLSVVARSGASDEIKSALV